VVKLVGVRKIVLNRLEIPEVVIEEGDKPSHLFQDLLKEYHTVTICSYGSKEHAKAGLLKENVLIKASGKRQPNKETSN